MKITPAELEQSGYVQLHELSHNDMLPFIKQYIKKPTIFGWGYYALTGLFFMVLVAVFTYFYTKHQLSLKEGINAFFNGLLLAFLLIPLHEYIHVLAYKKQGALNTSYDVIWKKLMFLAVADQFVANKREFNRVALAPFVVITLLLLLALPFANTYWLFMLLCINFWHLSFCVGDFALLSYFNFHRDIEIVTYDDKATKMSYFYYRYLPQK